MATSLPFMNGATENTIVVNKLGYWALICKKIKYNCTDWESALLHF